MKKFSVTIEAVRELLREALNGGEYVPDVKPVHVNAVIDKQAAETDPMNPRFVPQDKVELDNAIKVAVRDVPDDKISQVYAALKKSVVDSQKDEKQGEPKMKTDTQKKDPNQVEEMLRLQIRKILSEMPIDPADIVADEEEAEESDQQTKRRGKYKPSSTDFDADVSFSDVAKETGMSVAGAKQAVDKAMAKAQFMASMDMHDAQILTLNAVKDYIDFLSTSGELTPADVKLLKDHPKIAADLDGFREFFHDYVSHARKDEDPVEWLDEPSERAKIARAGSKRVMRGEEETEGE